MNSAAFVFALLGAWLSLFQPIVLVWVLSAVGPAQKGFSIYRLLSTDLISTLGINEYLVLSSVRYEVLVIIGTAIIAVVYGFRAFKRTKKRYEGFVISYYDDVFSLVSCALMCATMYFCLLLSSSQDTSSSQVSLEGNYFLLWCACYAIAALCAHIDNKSLPDTNKSSQPTGAVIDRFGTSPAQNTVSNSSNQLLSKNPVNTPKKTFEPVLGVETQALIKRAFLFIEDNDKLEAERYFEQALRQDPENSSAYLGKLMIELNVNDLEELANIPGSLKEQKLFQRALRFAHDEEKTKLEHCLEINEKNLEVKKEAINEEKYARVLALMKGKIISSYSAQNIIDILMSIVPYKDSEALIQEIIPIKQNLERLEKKYSEAIAAKIRLLDQEYLKNPDIEKFNRAAELFEELGDYKDSKYLAEQIRKSGVDCIKRIKQAESYEAAKRTAMKNIIAAVLIVGLTIYGFHHLGKNMMINKAENGDAEARLRLDAMYQDGKNKDRDAEQDFQRYKKFAEQGHAEAQFKLGTLYLEGNGTKQDYEQAFQWFKKSAEQNNAYAQYALGVMYCRGIGTKQDYEQAFQWFKKSAEQNNAGAQHALGDLYYRGEGTKQDYEQAFQWFKKSAEQNNANAQNALGVMYLKGEGVDVDFNKAKEWFTKAVANSPDRSIMKINLGYTYELQGDTSKAHEWYNEAVSQITDEEIRMLRSMVSQGNTRSPKSFLKYFDEFHHKR